MQRTVKKEGFRETGRGLARKAVYPMDFILSSMRNHGRLSSRSDMIQFKRSKITLAARWKLERSKSESKKF